MKYLAILFALASAITISAQNTSFTVTGTAKKLVNADEMIITAGLSDQNDDAAVLQKSMQEKMEIVLKYLKGKKGVKKFETDFIRIYNRGPIEKRGVLKQYAGSQSLSIVITDFELYDQLMIDLFDLGLNNIGNVSFNISNREEIKRQVQMEAIKVAKEKAKFFAEELGVALGRVLSFNEGSVAYTPIYTANTVQYDAKGGGDNESSSIAPSQVTIEMTVVVSFEIKNIEK